MNRIEFNVQTDERKVIELTPEEVTALQAAANAAAPTIKIAAVKAEAQRRILAKWPDWKQRNAALGLLEVSEVAACKKWIADVKAASNLIEQDIQASADPASFDVAGSARWPV